MSAAFARRPSDLKAVAGIVEHGEQEAVFTLRSRRSAAHGRQELGRKDCFGIEQLIGVGNQAGSQIVEKQALEALPLEPKRRLLPEVRLLIRGMVAHAPLATRTHFRSLFRIQTPRRREEIEGVGAVYADD